MKAKIIIVLALVATFGAATAFGTVKSVKSSNEAGLSRLQVAEIAANK